MKVLVIACVLFACLVAVQCNKEEMKKVLEQCKKENNVSEEECKAFHESGQDRSKATSNIKCATKCFFEKTQVLSKGALNEEALKPFVKDMPMENVKNAVETCNKESGVDECDDAFQKGMCLMETLNLPNSFE